METITFSICKGGINLIITAQISDGIYSDPGTFYPDIVSVLHNGQDLTEFPGLVSDKFLDEMEVLAVEKYDTARPGVSMLTISHGRK